jgi:hypothetical protein
LMNVEEEGLLDCFTPCVTGACRGGADRGAAFLRMTPHAEHSPAPGTTLASHFGHCMIAHMLGQHRRREFAGTGRHGGHPELICRTANLAAPILEVEESGQVDLQDPWQQRAHSEKTEFRSGDGVFWLLMAATKRSTSSSTALISGPANVSHVQLRGQFRVPKSLLILVARNEARKRRAASRAAPAATWSWAAPSTQQPDKFVNVQLGIFQKLRES